MENGVTATGRAAPDHISMRVESFDRIHSQLKGLPDTKMAGPSTKRSTLPILDSVLTTVVETHRGPETGFTIFIEIVDASGAQRYVLPDTIAQTIYRQRQSLVDRSTPESRRRLRATQERAKRKKEKEARRARFVGNGNK